MASKAIFSSLRRRRSQALEAFLSPVNLSDAALLQTLASVSNDIVSSFSAKSMLFQSKNCQSLIRKIKVFAILFDYFKEHNCKRLLNPRAVLCFKELYLLLYRSKILLDYCSQSSKLWLLLQNPLISGHFHDLNQEISTLLDVFPIGEIGLGEDVKELVELLHKQCRRVKLCIDEEHEELRIKLFDFVGEFGNGRVPDKLELKSLFVEKLMIWDANSCRVEIEFLEEQIANHNQDSDLEPSASILNGIVALTRYCRFLLFGFEEEEVKSRRRRMMMATSLTIPKDFCCPVSMDLMQDPVAISTGQTYDRCSISRWIEEGHSTCPKTGQTISHTHLVPNLALKNLIAQWCIAYGIEYNHPAEWSEATLPSDAALGANRATIAILVDKLRNGPEVGKAVVAREIRLLSRTWKENRALIGESGAIPLLHDLLASPRPAAQENSITAMLNLSIHNDNKTRIMNDRACLTSIGSVTTLGHTTEARENAAATLFSLSSVHAYKTRIVNEEGAVEALSTMMIQGTARGKKDAVSAIFNLSTHVDNCARLVSSGAVTALVTALSTELVAEEAAGALGLILRRPVGAEAVAREDGALAGLVAVIRYGTPRGKENAVAALLEYCRSGGGAVKRVLEGPSLGGLIQGLLFSGTRRARRKAAALARVLQRCEYAAAGGFGGGYGGRDVRFGSEVTVPMPISVPVL